MIGSILFSPLLPWAVIAVLGVLSFLGIIVAAFFGLSGWALRAGAASVVVLALAGPVYQQEDRAPLSDIVILLEDRSASQRLSDRPDQVTEAAETMVRDITALGGTEIRRIDITEGEGNSGTRMMRALNAALAEEPRARIAGVVAITDGRVHDATLSPDLPAPFHLLQTGRADDWDRRLVVTGAPAFAIIDEPVDLNLRIEDQGAAPDASSARLQMSINGDAPIQIDVGVNTDITLPVTLPRGGQNVIELRVIGDDSELTQANNTALLQLNGVRDRLRVLLVSGEPHPGGRTWRNLLKSDASVDLVHFTILRPPEKQDGVPVSELSLIAFPTRELFLDKIDEFDLIIFDRYQRRGILPAIYLDNVAQYARDGGAVLVAAGPDFAAASSLYRSPLGSILPAEPTARVYEEPYQPSVTDVGARHPVTQGLPGAGDWGRWLRQVEVSPTSGHVAMVGLDERPLLVLDRVEDGRVALLASDHAWLWSRGYEGGGPQLELLRRLAHWMMSEPELEEEALTATASERTMRIQRRTLSEEIGPVTITAPDGTERVVELSQVRPGQFAAEIEVAEIGLYRLSDGEQDTVIGVGPSAPREFEQTIATAEILEPVIAQSGGGAFVLDDGLPRVRSVREGRPANGRGWLGVTSRNAFETLDLRQTALLPPWVVLLLSTGLLLAGWLREGRR